MINLCECKTHTYRCLHDMMGRIVGELSGISDEHGELVYAIKEAGIKIDSLTKSIDALARTCEKLEGFNG